MEELVVVVRRKPEDSWGVMTTHPATDPANLSTGLEMNPSVALSGQGGQLQAFTVRGIGAERIRVTLNGAPIRALRRAGVDGAFLEPAWTQISSRPLSAPVHTGSGTTGGVIETTIDATTVSNRVAAQMGHPGHTSRVRATGSVRNVSGGVSYQRESDRYSPSGERLNTSYERASGVVHVERSLDDARDAVTVLLSEGRDLGKSSSDFPQRETNYPLDQHVAATLSRSGSNGSALLWGHYQALQTAVDSDAFSSSVDASVFDYGLRYARNAEVAAGLELNWGGDLNGRFNYDIVEDESRALRDGRATEMSAYLNAEKAIHRWTVAAGARVLHFDARADDVESYDQSSVIGRMSVAWHATDDVRLELAASRTITHPTLSQLHFSGTTGRGTVVGNDQLDPEHAWVYELTGAWSASSGSIMASAFDMDLESFIEKYEIATDTETFVNSDAGRLRGIVVNAEASLGPLAVRAGYSHVRGELDGDRTLRDLPNDELRAGLSWQFESTRIDVTARHRFEGDAVAVGNSKADHRTLLDASLRHDVTSAIEFEIFGRNLLNQEYWVTDDRKSPLGAERSLGVGIVVDI